MQQGISRYALLANTLRNEIAAEKWAPGEALPSEATLASHFNVALGTLRKALDLLAEQGVIERVHGKGTFVRGALSGSGMYRFFRFSDGTPQSRLLALNKLAADTHLAAQLQLPAGAQVLELKRLRSMADEPALFESIYLDAERFSALENLDFKAAGDLLYPIYQAHCGQVVNRAVDTISFGWMDAEAGACLQVPEGSAAAIVQRQAFSMKGEVLEWRITKGNALKFNYTVKLN